VPDPDPEATRHPPRRALPLHATAPYIGRAGPTPAASGQTPPPPPSPHLASPCPRLSSRPHPSTHPPRLVSIHSDHAPPIFALSAHLHFPAPVSVLDTGAHPSALRFPRGPVPIRSRLDLVQDGGEPEPRRAGGLLLVCPAGGPAAPWAGRLSALRISSSTGGKVLVSPSLCFFSR